MNTEQRIEARESRDSAPPSSTGDVVREVKWIENFRFFIEDTTDDTAIVFKDTGNPVLVAEMRADLRAAITALTAAEALVTAERHRAEIAERENEDFRKCLAAAGRREVRLRSALTWYAVKVTECRKITSHGDEARHELDGDGGKRARTALTEATPEDGE